MDRLKQGVKHSVKHSVKQVAALSKFQQVKGDDLPQDVEFETYRESLEYQIKQVDQIQKALGVFAHGFLGMAQSTLELGESLETFYGDGNGREVAAKFLLTQLKFKISAQDLGEGSQHVNESLTQYRERLVGMRGKIAVRDEMVASLHKAGILVETRRRKYETSKEKKLERLAKFDQTVAARDALKIEFEEKNADLKLELMDLDLNRALHVESMIKKMMDDQLNFLTNIAEGIDFLRQAKAIETVRVIPTLSRPTVDHHRKHEDEDREHVFNSGLYAIKETPPPRPEPASPSSPLTPLSSSCNSLAAPLSVSTGSAPLAKPRRTTTSEPANSRTLSPKPLPRLPPTPTPTSGGHTVTPVLVEPEPQIDDSPNLMHRRPSIESSPRLASPTPARKALPILPPSPEASATADASAGLGGSGIRNKPQLPAKPPALGNSGSKIMPVPPPKPSMLTATNAAPPSAPAADVSTHSQPSPSRPPAVPQSPYAAQQQSAAHPPTAAQPPAVPQSPFAGQPPAVPQSPFAAHPPDVPQSPFAAPPPTAASHSSTPFDDDSILFLG